MLSLSAIRRMAFASAIDQSLIKAIAILCGSNLHVLRQNYVFIDEYGEYHEIDHHEYEVARSDGWLVHPRTGDKVYNFLDYVYPFYDLDLATLDEEQGGEHV
ncbi:hypothetical protein SAMN05421779_10757 [Insolitispirillum peregrinum]|uniref:Uncharacterized protein n=2 Tax=Insolitispirillum peregrinum TaxID=80876 RepID=A0A1N7PL83_9PROT|nr:hypothetical protein SAMN05421779_10757 [Insolitispirillum peregrinum]